MGYAGGREELIRGVCEVLVGAPLGSLATRDARQRCILGEWIIDPVVCQASRAGETEVNGGLTPAQVAPPLLEQSPPAPSSLPGQPLPGER